MRARRLRLRPRDSRAGRLRAIIPETAFLQAKQFGPSPPGAAMFLKNCWYVAALDHELIDGKLLSRMILGEHLLLYRGESGKVFALNDRCPHRGALLSKGRLEGDNVRCMYHGIQFGGTGKCLQIPGQAMIPPKLRVRSYPVVERSHFIWIWMGEADKADPSLIVELPYLHDSRW